MSRREDQARADSWRALIRSAVMLRDKFDEIGIPYDRDFWQSEVEDRLQRANEWQARADAPWWKRWFM